MHVSNRVHRIGSALNFNRLASLLSAALMAGLVSQPASTILAEEPALEAAGTPCVTPPGGLVGWWKGEDNGIDTVGLNHGTVGTGVSFAAGMVSHGFQLASTSQGIRIPASAAIDVGTGAGMSMECWVNLEKTSGNNPLMEWNDGVAGGTLWGSHFYVINGAVYANLVTTSGTWRQINSAAGIVTSNQFHHLALTYDKASGVARLYRNGAVIAQQNLGSFTPDTRYDLYLGKRPAGDVIVNSVGLIDEASLYNRALTSNEVTAIYTAGSAGKCSSPAALFTAYIVPAGTVGNQSLPVSQTQTLGNDFDVQSPIEIKSLGVFDSGGDGLVGTLVARIYNRDTQAPVASLTFTSADPGTLVGGSRFKDLPAPLILPAGFRGVCSVAYLGTTALEPDGNLREGSGNWTTDSGGGLISFVGMGRHSMMGTGDAYPDIVDPAPAPNNFAAGTFTFSPRGSLLPLLVVPNYLRTNDADFGGGTLHHVIRNQQVYASTEFPGPIRITELRYRPDRRYGSAFSTVISNLQVNLSTTAKQPYGLSATYAQNVGPDDTMVFSGSLAIASQFSGPTNGPKDFDIIIPLQTPFVYNPAQGNLLVDTRNFSGSTATFLSGSGGLPSGSRAFGIDVNSSTAAYVADGIDALGIVYEPVAAAPTYDLSHVSLLSNPNGAWSFGSETNVGVGFALLPVSGVLPADNGVSLEYRQFASQVEPTIWHNATTQTGTAIYGQCTIPPGTVILNPNAPSQVPCFPLVRFTVPAGAGGQYLVESSVAPQADGSWQGSTDYHVVRNGVELFGQPLPAGARTGYTNTLDLAAGGTVEFVVGPGTTDGKHKGLKLAAKLTLLSTNIVPQPPTLTQQPVSQSVVAGDSVTLTVAATGDQPLRFQWYRNGDGLGGQTNNSLLLPDVQSDQAGNYSVTVSNGAGGATSSNALLTVLVPDCTSAPAGLVAWWPATDSTLDAVTTNHGISGFGVDIAPGKVGRSFQLGVTNDGIKVPAAPALNLGANDGLTIECWINPATTTGNRPLVEWNDGIAGGTLWGAHFHIGPLAPGTLYANLVDTNGTWHTINSTAGLVTTNEFQHVAITYDKASGVARLFRNGQIVAQKTLGSFTPDTRYDLYLGKRPAGDVIVNAVGRLDEVSLYSRALSSNEMAAIYGARGTGKCPLPPNILAVTPPGAVVNEGASVSFTATAAGSPTLAYQWQFGGNDLTGETNATLALNSVTYSQGGIYTVAVSNPAGSASSNVVLKVNRAPIADAGATDKLLISPNGSNVVAVLDASLSTDPDDDELTYAWFHTGDGSPFATGVVTVTTLPVGTNQLTLAVNDGLATGSQAFAIEVITTSEAVDRLAELVTDSAANPQPLLASLRAALAAIDRIQPETAINQLEAFINKVQAQVAPLDPALAGQLIADAQAIIDALNGGGAPAPAVALEIISISPNNQGKPHLKIKGVPGRVHIVETSTDMVNWVKVGIANSGGGTDYQFDDPQASAIGPRYYRVVTPK